MRNYIVLDICKAGSSCSDQNGLQQSGDGDGSEHLEVYVAGTEGHPGEHQKRDGVRARAHRNPGHDLGGRAALTFGQSSLDVAFKEKTNR